MAMRPCNKCHKNNWKYKVDKDNIVCTATCQCGNVISWTIKEKTKIENEGDLCRKCKHPVALEPLKITQKKKNQPFYYTHWFICHHCGTTYMSKKFEVSTGKKIPTPNWMGKNPDGTLFWKGK